MYSLLQHRGLISQNEKSKSFESITFRKPAYCYPAETVNTSITYKVNDFGAVSAAGYKVYVTNTISF